MASRKPRQKQIASAGFWSGLAEVYRHMSPARRRQFYLLLALMLVGAAAELATIGAVLPFLSLLADPSALDRFPFAIRIFSALGADSLGQRLVAATVVFSLLVIVSGSIRFQLARLIQNFGYALAHELTLEIQRRFLAQPYAFHVQSNTSTLISALDKAEILVFEVLIPLMQATIAAFIAIFIVAALIAVDPATALIAAAAFTSIYLLVSALTRRRLAANSLVISRGFDERLKVVQESLGGIRDVIIDGSQSTYLDLYDRENARLARARANTAVIAAAPRFIIETIGIVAIAAIALAASDREGGFAAALPVLGAIALGAQRLLPLVQQVYNGWSTASGYLSVVGQTVEMLGLPAAPEEAPENLAPLALRKTISVEGLGFAYPNRKRPALQAVSFDIPAGSAVALVGETGSGKSTLADLLMGLLDPDEGQISIDGVRLSGRNRRRWQRSIAHVPQSIFLADASIARNISLGRPDKEIDVERVVDAAKTAQLHEFVSSLPDGYETMVGERGIRLSGGQRQRLGIARAIYKGSPVLVLDEASSALDEATEEAVFAGLEELRKQGRTLIIIAHRLSTIARCDSVVRLHAGRIVELGSLAEVIGARKESKDSAA
jgi:ATP-binding cassette subfamily B protein